MFFFFYFFFGQRIQFETESIIRLTLYSSQPIRLQMFFILAINRFNGCMCVCLRANLLDVVRLGFKVDQGLPCLRDYFPRSSCKPL